MNRALFGLMMIAVAAEGVAAEVGFTITDARGQPVQDAVVSLVPVDAALPKVQPLTSPEIRQEKQEFMPYVTAVVVGTQVAIANRDTAEHHGYSQSQAKKFNIPLQKPGSMVPVLFDQPGAVAIGCNIHDWMIAYVVVVETPWFAQTPPAGKATIADVPPGRYRATIWHPQLAVEVKRDVTVAAAPASESISLTLRPDRRIRRPADVGGGVYR